MLSDKQYEYTVHNQYLWLMVVIHYNTTGWRQNLAQSHRRGVIYYDASIVYKKIDSFLSIYLIRNLINTFKRLYRSVSEIISRKNKRSNTTITTRNLAIVVFIHFKIALHHIENWEFRNRNCASFYNNWLRYCQLPHKVILNYNIF